MGLYTTTPESEREPDPKMYQDPIAYAAMLASYRNKQAIDAKRFDPYENRNPGGDFGLSLGVQFMDLDF
jgi:hypothetical protein